MQPDVSTASNPTSGEVKAEIFYLQKKYGDLLRVKSVLKTKQGRSIYAATVTDRTVSDKDKQNVLIVAGQHGNEESGRMIALALIRWLCLPQQRTMLAQQKIVVMPNVSPDAAETDSHKTPAGVHPNLDHPPSGAQSPEGQAVEKVAFALAPEVFVDMHAKGGAGCGFDMVLFPVTRCYTEDDFLIHRMASEMAAAGEKAGIPHVTHSLSWPGWGGSDLNEPSTTLFAYRNFKSIVFLTETSEHNEVTLPPALRIRSGLARLKALLKWGSRRYDKLYYSGYPCMAVLGSFHVGVVAAGKTAAARRRSRLEIWEQIDGFKKITMKIPEQHKHKQLFVEYDGKPIRHGAGFQMSAQGRLSVDVICVNGRKLKPSETNGYYTWQEGNMTFVVVVLNALLPGEYQIDVELI